jgi:hypothetical protein
LDDLDASGRLDLRGAGPTGFKENAASVVPNPAILLGRVFGSSRASLETRTHFNLSSEFPNFDDCCFDPAVAVAK